MRKHFLPIRSFVRIAPTAPTVTPNGTLNCVSSSVIDSEMNSVMKATTTTNVGPLTPNAEPTTIQRCDSCVIPRHTTRLSPHFAPLCSAFCAALSAAVFTSCGAAQVDLEAITTPPESVTIANDLVTIPQGIAVAVRVRTDASYDPESSGPHITMTSANPAVISVWPTTRENVFVLGGASQGVAAFSVSVRGEGSHSFTATVVPNANAEKSGNKDTDENPTGQSPSDNQTPEDNASISEALTQPLAPCTRQ